MGSPRARQPKTVLNAYPCADRRTDLQPSTATRDMQARLEEEAEGAGGGIPEGTQTAAASHTPDSPSVSPAALEAPAAEAACCHSESRPTKQHCAPAAVRDLAHAQVPASPARDKHTSTRAKPAAHNSAEPSGWYEAGKKVALSCMGNGMMPAPSG